MIKISKRKIRRESNKYLDEYALKGTNEQRTNYNNNLAEAERKKLNKMLTDLSIESELPNDIDTNLKVVKTIEDLRSKVLRNIEELLDSDDDNIRMLTTFNASKYLFEQKRSVTGKLDNNIKMDSLLNIDSCQN